MRSLFASYRGTMGNKTSQPEAEDAVERAELEVAIKESLRASGGGDGGDANGCLSEDRTEWARLVAAQKNSLDTSQGPISSNHSNSALSSLKLCPVFTFFHLLMTKKIVSYLHIHLFSIVLHRRCRIPKRPMYLLIVGSHYCVMRFAYALHMCQHNFVPFPCLYIEFFELVIEVIFHYCTTPPCHKINLFKHP